MARQNFTAAHLGVAGSARRVGRRSRDLAVDARRVGSAISSIGSPADRTLSGHLAAAGVRSNSHPKRTIVAAALFAPAATYAARGEGSVGDTGDTGSAGFALGSGTVFAMRPGEAAAGSVASLDVALCGRRRRVAWARRRPNRAAAIAIASP